jgi:hypothetical protein
METKGYLRCEIFMNQSAANAWLRQPFVVNHIFDAIGGLNMKYRAPRTPGFNIIHPVTPDEQISEKDQTIYCTGVGTLLYLMKYSWPDLLNVVLKNCLSAWTKK